MDWIFLAVEQRIDDDWHLSIQYHFMTINDASDLSSTHAQARVLIATKSIVDV
jgi:hypothetical protein